MNDLRRRGGASDMPPPEEREIRSLSPEARRRARAALFARQVAERDGDFSHGKGWRERCMDAVGPQSRAFEVIRRTIAGTYNDGFIHAGNLAYLSMLSIFPFFILAGALFQLLGEVEERRMIIETVVLAMPPTVQGVIQPVAENVIDARSGWFLWFGAAAGLWSVSSLIETIRDVLRRAYGTRAVLAFWRYRLASAGLIILAVVLLLLSLFAQVAIGTAQQFIMARLPQLAEVTSSLGASRIVPALGLFGSLYLLFWSLAPVEYRAKIYPKWPGALFTTLWWLAATTAMPPVVRSFFTYNLTYGSLAGIMIALLFFWLVGLGVVIGAELNAALAEPENGEPDAGKRLKEDAA
ncbi:MAG: YihY/virulence factor BrkB family protein [Pseudomonadota bacterium]